jgi:serine/threonine protein kinase
MVPSQRYCTKCGAANQAQDAFCFACGQALQVPTASQQYTIAGSATNTSTGLLTPNLLLKQRYRILGPVGKGGFGAVYKAEDIQLGNRLLAVKEMGQSSLSQQEIMEAAENFKREAHILAALKHPNLPSIYDHFSEVGRWYLVMDFIEGETLEEHLTKEPEGHLSVEETLQIGIQLCIVLSYLHSRQPPIIFRDLKPANIMVTPEGHLYLIDFGIARHFKPGQTRDTIAFGSAGYAAPEQYGKAQTTARSDIYSLGATLHQLLTGIDPSHTPFQFTSLQLQSQPIPPGLEPLILQMLDMNESKRPASMIAVKQELQSISTQQTAGQVNIPQPGTLAQTVTRDASLLPQARTSPPGSHQQMGTPKIAASHYLKAKRYQEALAAFEQAIRLDPDDASIYNGKGLVLRELKRSQEALAAYERAIRLDPNYAEAYFNKGNVLDDLEHYEEALAAYEQAIRLDPNDADFYNNMGQVLYELRSYEEALAACEQAIRLDPDDAVANNTYGDVLSELGFYEEALAAYDQSIRLNPNNAAVHNDRGYVLDQLGHYKEALAACEQAIHLDSNFADAYFNKGIVLYQLKRYHEALESFDEAIQRDPDNEYLWQSKGNTLKRLRWSEEAHEAYERARQLGYHE